MKTLREKGKGDIDKDFSRIFWQLSSASSDERENAANYLLNAVHTSDKSSTFSNANASVISDNGQQDPEQKDKLQYTLERLFKGLAGQKPESKLGFSLALTLLLESLGKGQVRTAFGTGEKCLLNMKVDTKQEASSKRIGVCLLLLSSTRSGTFVKLRPEQRGRLLDAVTPLLEDRGHADLAAFALTGAVEQLSPDEFKSHLFEKLSTKLSTGFESLDANGLLLLLCCQQHQKDTISRAYLKSHYAAKHLISQANFQHFLRVCLSTADDSHETLVGCRLHPGVERLLDCLLAKSPNLLSTFAASVAEAALANVDSTPSRKALGLAVLAWLADQPAERFQADDSTTAKADCLSVCLASDEVCRQLHSHASSKKSLLHEFACRLLSKQLLPGSTVNQAILVAVANRLLGVDCLFDDGLPVESRVLRADTMARLPVELLDSCASRIEAELSSYAASSKQSQQPDSNRGLQQRRRVAFALQTLRQLVSGCRSLLSGKSKSCSRILLLLAELFLPGKSLPSDASVATDARSAFCRALDSMSSAALSGGSTYRRGYRRCLRHLAQGLIDKLATISDESSAVRRALTAGVEMLRQSGSAASEEDAEDSAVSCGGIDWCFALAFLHLGFHMLPGGSGSALKGSDNAKNAFSIDEASVDEASAQSLIDDLTECRRRSANGDGSGGAAGDNQPRWPDVLLDSFVGLLAASRSRLLRSVASLVARQVAPMVTPDGVAALTQLLLEGDADAAEDGEDDEDDEESGSLGDEVEDKDAADGGDNGDEEESEISISEASDSDSGAVDPDFRRACKSALGDAACPSDGEADMDPSDLSDSAMERVDQVLSLAFRSQLGPGRRGEHAATLERRRRRCQAKLRLLDVAEPLLLAGGSQCRLSIAACLAQLALLAAGGGAGVAAEAPAVGGGFWSSAPANERDQLRQRSLSLLKRVAAANEANEVDDVIKDVDDQLARAVEAALAANLKSPLPTKIAETAAEILSALLRLRPSAVESRLASALSRQLSPSPLSGASRRFRLGGLALWQRVCSERPGLLAGLRRRLLDLLTSPSDVDESANVNGEGDSYSGQRLKVHDRAALASLAVCLVKNSNVDVDVDDFYRRLAEWTFDRLNGETGPAGISSTHLLTALLQLAAALLRRDRQLASPSSPGLVDSLRAIRAGSRSRDLRRGLQACLAELAAAADGSSKKLRQKKKEKRKKRAKPETATEPDEDEEVPTGGKSKKRRRVDPAAIQEELMEAE